MALINHPETVEDILREASAMPVDSASGKAERAFLIGGIRQILGQDDQAVSLFRQALALDPHGFRVPELQTRLAKLTPTN